MITSLHASTPQQHPRVSIARVFQAGAKRLGLGGRVAASRRTDSFATSVPQTTHIESKVPDKAPADVDEKHKNMESVIISQEPSRSPSEKREPNVDLPPLPYTNSPASVTGMAQDEKQMPQELPHQSDSGLPEYDDSGVAFTAYLPLAEVEHLPIRTRSPSPVPGSVKEEQKTAPIEQEPETSPAADGQDQDREIYEPRAAYDYVEDELDETDSPVYDAPPSSSSQSQSQSAEKAPPEAGEESWEDDNGEQRYEERFRLTPCVELEDEDDESGDERRKEIPVEVRIEGQVVAEVPSQQSQPEEAQQETRPETQTHPNALPGRQERELTPEEEAQWIAHWENNRVVCERHATALEAILAAQPSNKAWLERGGLDVDELLRCLRWTPEGLGEVKASGVPDAGGVAEQEGEKEKAGEGEEVEKEKEKERERQRKLRELRRLHRRNVRRMLENTRKVDQMMAVLQDLIRGMSEAAEKKRAARREERAKEEAKRSAKGKERERERERDKAARRPSSTPVAADVVKQDRKERPASSPVVQEKSRSKSGSKSQSRTKSKSADDGGKVGQSRVASTQFRRVDAYMDYGIWTISFLGFDLGFETATDGVVYVDEPGAGRFIFVSLL